VQWDEEPVDAATLTKLLDEGLPPEAVRADGTLDPDALRQHGWVLERGWLSGPPEDD
jgi:hypothetical protein